MRIKEADRVPAKPVDTEGAEGVQIRLLIHEADGARNFYMRQFDLAPGGCTPRHEHAWEHEVYVLAGSGVVTAGDAEQRVRTGDCVFIAPGEIHQFCNNAAEPLKFLCLVPRGAK